MKLLKFISLLLFMLSAMEVVSQERHDFFVTPTSINHTIFIEASANPTINGAPLQQGDLIGVFYQTDTGLACGGYTEWLGEDTFITAYGKDDSLAGFERGEEFTFMVAKNGSNCVLDEVTVTYETGGIILNTDQFDADGISKIGSLDAKDYLFEENFDVIVTDATCIAGGKILVEGVEDNAMDGAEIHAKALFSRDEYTDDNEIVEMPIGAYRLTINRQGCTLQLQDFAEIKENKDCDFPIINLNTEGARDYYIPFQGTAKIYDRFGVLMLELPVPSTWDATDQAGRLLPMGTYIIVCEGEPDIMITIIR